MNEYNLCSLLVHIEAKKSLPIKNTLQQQSGVEVHAVTEGGRLIVTIEAESRKIIVEKMLDIQKMSGVYNASMIYQFSDDINESEFEEANMRISA